MARSAFVPLRWFLFVLLVGPCGALAAAAPAPGQISGQTSGPASQPAPISLELNKLAPVADGNGCRIYFVIANPGKQAVTELQLDLVLFGTDGIISRRVAVEVGPLPADKTVVRLFDLAATKCGSIGHVLLNDVLSCRVEGAAEESANDQRAACLKRIAVSSRAAAPLTK